MKDIDQASDCISRFREVWHHQTDLLSYLDKNYFGLNLSKPIEGQEAQAQSATPEVAATRTQAQEEDVVNKRKRWMLCYRQELDYPAIDTNNYIESWHNTLKRHFFKDQQKRRVDMVVYILAKMAIPHFQHKVMRSVVKVGKMDRSQKIELDSTRRARVRLAELESKGLTGWRQVSDTVVHVSSFVKPGVEYLVTVTFEYSALGHILNCSCDSIRKKYVCQHIALLQLKLSPLSYLREGFMRYHNNFQASMLETVEEPNNQASLSVQSDYFSLALERLVQLDKVRDKNKPVSNMNELCDAVKKLLGDFEAGIDYPKVRETQKW